MRVIVKIYDTSTQATNPLYPNLPAIEVRSLDYLSRLDIAPRLLDSWEKQTVNGDETSATLVYEYLAGNVWQTDTAAVAQLLSRLHDPMVTPPPHWLRPLPLSAHEVCLHGEAILLRVNASEVDCLKQLRPRSPSREEVTKKSVIHGDCWGGNFIQGEMGLRLIDWQCPGVGDAASWHWRLACYYLYRQKRLKGVKPELSDGYGEALAKEVAYLQALSLVS